MTDDELLAVAEVLKGLLAERSASTSQDAAQVLVAMKEWLKRQTAPMIARVAALETEVAALKGQR